MSPQHADCAGQQQQPHTGNAPRCLRDAAAIVGEWQPEFNIEASRRVDQLIAIGQEVR